MTILEAINAKISPRSAVLRLLPHRERRMVGAWCFADLYGPRDIDPEGDAMHVAPHPHMGLQTVSWLVSGEVTHRDSMGNTSPVTPGHVAIMTAGSGISHAEDVVPEPGSLHGAQLWIALPDAVRHQPRSFEVVPAVAASVGALDVRVFAGQLGGAVSPAVVHTPLVGAEITPASADGAGGARASVPLQESYEHLVVPLAGTATVDGEPLEPGHGRYLDPGRTSVDLALTPDARVLLLGGEPFEEEIVMWWNLVGRTHEEIVAAREEWNARGGSRFGEVAQYPTDERIDAPPLPNVRLRARGRVR